MAVDRRGGGRDDGGAARRGGDSRGGSAAAAIASRGGVVIQPENYILNLDSGRSVDVDVLAEYGGADIDIGFMPAKYRVSRPAAGGRKDENDTVNVYPSGKIVCLGARSVEKAQDDVKMVLRRLGVATAVGGGWTTETEDEGEAAMCGADDGDNGEDGDAKDLAKVRYVVASGCIFGAHDIYKAIPLLEDRYEVTLDSEVFSGYFVRSREGGGVSVQVFAHQAGGGGGARTPLLCRGPTIRDVQAVVGDVYRMIVKANDAGEEAA